MQNPSALGILQPANSPRLAHSAEANGVQNCPHRTYQQVLCLQLDQPCPRLSHSALALAGAYEACSFRAVPLGQRRAESLQEAPARYCP
jgi:hypothetical protein